LWPGAFTSGGIHEVIYDGSNFRVLNPGSVYIRQAFRVKAAFGSDTTVTASTTISCSVVMWRRGNDANIRMAHGGGGVTRKRTTWQASTATYFYLSGLPSWILPTSADVVANNTQIFFTSGSVERVGTNQVYTDGRLYFYNNGDNFDDNATIFPFHITYPVK
jgi:hypothetical protein